MTKTIVYGVIVLVCCTAAQGEFCYNINSGSYTYCSTGCCGTIYQYCCYDSTTRTTTRAPTQGEYCYNNNYAGWRYCLTGCCGTYNYQYCCYDSTIRTTTTTAATSQGEYCYNNNYDDIYNNNYEDMIYCSTGCCGTYNNKYCCSTGPNVGLIIGLVVGSVVLVLIVASVIVAVCCCCRKSRGQAGQVYQTTYPMAVYGSPVSPPDYCQVAYVNGAASAQILTANVQPGTTQRWEAATTINERTSPENNTVVHV